jgi:hypothetical protein
MKPEEAFEKWFESFEVALKKLNPYCPENGYKFPDSPLAMEDKYFTHEYKLREKHCAGEREQWGSETFYITGVDLKEAFLAGYEFGKKK